MAKVAKYSRFCCKAAVIFGVGADITKKDEEIRGCRLPKNEQVLRCYKFHKHKECAQGTATNRTKKEECKDCSGKDNSILSQRKHFYGFKEKGL